MGDSVLIYPDRAFEALHSARADFGRAAPRR
jgi:hypothetical protein